MGRIDCIHEDRKPRGCLTGAERLRSPGGTLNSVSLVLRLKENTLFIRPTLASLPFLPPCFSGASQFGEQANTNNMDAPWKPYSSGWRKVNRG